MSDLAGQSTSLCPGPCYETFQAQNNDWKRVVVCAGHTVSDYFFHLPGGESVSQSVFVNEDIYRINKLTTTDKALYRFYVADKSVPPIYLRELS